MDHFVQTAGTELFWQGKPLRLRGFGIGTWLNMEHFMLGIPTPDSMIRSAFAAVYGAEQAESFFNALVSNFITRKDFELLKSLGVNFLRVPFNYRLLLDDQTGAYRESGFALLKGLFDLCEEFEIFVMPDLHAAPGGQNPDWHSDNRTGVPQFWEFAVFQKQVTGLWGEIARRFAGYSHILGYDLLNEPSMASADKLNIFYTETIAEIRRYDKNHSIVLEGDGFAMDFRGLKKFDDENIILSFHFYPTVWNKNLLDKAMGREERRLIFEEGFLQLAGIRERFNRPVICGEAGYDLDAADMPFCITLLEDTLSLFEKYSVGWALWAYKDACFMGMVHPKTDSPWMEFAGKIKRRWTHYGEMEQANRLVAAAAGDFGGIDEKTAYRLQFRMRGILYEMQKEKILIPLLREIPWDRIIKLPESFLPEQCEVWEEYGRLIQQFTAEKEH